MAEFVRYGSFHPRWVKPANRAVVESIDKIEMLRIALGNDTEAVLSPTWPKSGEPARSSCLHEFVSRDAAQGVACAGSAEPIWKERSADELIECQRHESLLNVAFGHGELVAAVPLRTRRSSMRP